MYRTLLSLILTLFNCVALHAQQDVATVPISLSRVNQVSTASSKEGELLLLFQNGRKLQVVVLGSNYVGKEEHNIELGKTNSRDVVVGVTLDKEKICIYLRNETTRAFTALIFLRVTEAMTYNSLGTLPKQHFLLRYFVHEGSFILVTVPKGSNTVHLYQSRKGETFEETTFTTSYNNLYNRLSTNLEMVNEEPLSEVAIEYVYPHAENNTKSTYPTKKMYVQGDKIFMTFDEPETTHLLEFNLRTQLCDYKALSFHLDRGDLARNKQGNSFLFEHYLLRATVSPDQLLVNIIDLSTSQTIQSYSLYPEDKNSALVNGDFVEENTQDAEPTKIKDAKAFFNRVLNGNVAIAANRIDSLHISARIGSFQQSTNWAGGMGGGSINLSMGMGMGYGYGAGMTMPMGNGWGGPYVGMGYPGYMGPGYPYSGGNYSVNISQVFFPTVFEDKSFAHSTALPAPAFTQQIQDYERATFRKNTPEHIRLIPLQDNLMLFGSYGKNHSYRLVEFKR